MFGNPFFGRLSDRTSSRLGMRRPWIVVGLVGGSVGCSSSAWRPTVAVVLSAGAWRSCGFNALLAALVAVLPDQVPGRAAGHGRRRPRCLPAGRVGGRHLSGQAVHRHQLAMFLAPCVVGGVFILLFALTLNDRRLDPDDKPAWSLRELAGTFYVDPRKNPDFAWAFASRFMFVLAYAFLTTYQAYYLLDQLGTAEADVPQQVFLGTLVQSVVSSSRPCSAAGSRTGPADGRSSSSPRRSCTASRCSWSPPPAASTDSWSGWPSAASASALYMAVDLALVVDVLPDPASAAKDLGVLNIAGALPSSVAPAIAPAILALGGGSYGVLYTVAGVCAILGGLAILPVRRTR